ncbi:MAG: hypothetical protein ACE5JB_05960 [bacterium]
MGKSKGAISWILLIIVVVVGLIIGRSIWFSLKDTRAKLKEQELTMAELARKDSLMRVYVDSLDFVLLDLQQKEEHLAAEREQLKKKLNQLQIKYNKTMVRLDTLWEAGSVINELDQAYPHWKGQFWEAKRADGIHGLIAPRLFGADAAETKTKLDNSLKKITLKDSTIAVLDSSLAIKNEEAKALILKADSLQSTYNNLWGEYQVLDEKYKKLLKRKWFTLHLSPGNILTTGVGFAAGYAIGKQ